MCLSISKKCFSKISFSQSYNLKMQKDIESSILISSYVLRKEVIYNPV